MVRHEYHFEPSADEVKQIRETEEVGLNDARSLGHKRKMLAELKKYAAHQPDTQLIWLLEDLIWRMT